MTLTDEQCRRLVELLDVVDDNSISTWQMNKRDYRVRVMLDGGKPGSASCGSGPTPSAALLAALEKASK